MMKWLAQSTIYRDSVDLLCVDDAMGQRYYGAPVRIEMNVHDPNSAIGEPTLALRPDAARSLMQALWDAGIRPADLGDSAGEIVALRNHVSFAEHVAKTLLLPSNTST
jgi:hypothetical protein